MRRALFKNVSLYARTYNYNRSPQIPHYQTLNLIPKFNLPNFHRFFSDDSNSSDQNPKPLLPKDDDFVVKDVSNDELKARIEKYWGGDEEALPSVLEAILARKLSGKHEETDDEIMEKLKFAPLDDIPDEEVQEDFDEAIETDDDTSNVKVLEEKYIKKMVDDEYFNMDDKKWNAIVDEAKQLGIADDHKECQEILHDMIYWDKVLSEDLKQKVRAKVDELAEKIEKNELKEEEAYEQYKVFEDKIVKDEEERLLRESDEVEEPVDKKSDDPPGVGPILRWQQRLVVVPGADAWHPKNRRVKLSVTVKELGLSKYQFRRMRKIVGNKYHSGKDELTITCDRFDCREENRKDCLRALLGIIEEAGKADALVDEARTVYVKQRLKANPAFMARLNAKATQTPAAIPA